MPGNSAFFGDYSIVYASAHRGDALYDIARSRGRKARLLARITRRPPRRLTELYHLIQRRQINDRHYDGDETVPISKIKASAGRSKDFDADFNPVTDRTRQRWVSVANARWQGTYLPPVDLIKIDDTYAVRDGHHRISVAKAMGSDFIDAHVTVWKLTN